jgi:pimeloyl-ACP methyl ester carboxylesterase
MWRVTASCVLVGTLLTIVFAGSARSVGASATAAVSSNFTGLVEIGDGRRLFLECRGVGSTTVILESGYRNNAEIWQVTDPEGQASVFDGIARFTRVCAYDRPGTLLDQEHVSRSDPVPMPRDASAIAADLHALIEAADIPGPYVLVAHSLGGLFARLYAATYPDEIVGIVLVDAWQEELPDILGPEAWAAYEAVAAPAPPGLEGYADLERVDFRKASAILRAAVSAHPLPEMPLVVISRVRPVRLPQNVPANFSPDAFERGWREGQNRLALLLPDARHEIAARSDHYVQLEQPDLVIAAVKAVIDAARDPSSWDRAATVAPSDG